jgi:hypothetical protein
MNKHIISHLSQDFIEGKRIFDSEYTNIVKLTTNNIKSKSEDVEKLTTLIIELGPCTIITYSLYFDILRAAYPKEVTNDMIEQLLESINDIRLPKTTFNASY